MLLPVAVVVLDVVWVAGAFPEMWPFGWPLVVVSGAVLALRRRYPVLTLVVTAGCALGYYPGGFPDSPMGIALLIAVAGVARYCRRPTAIVAVALILAAFLAVGRHARIEDHAGLGVVLLAAVVVGELWRDRQERIDAAGRRAGEAVLEERLRIARELHDVAAHQISLITVQAGAALHRRDPDTAFAALETIRAASREALRDMRTVLGVLRQVDGAEPVAPSLAAVAGLVAAAQASDLRVRVTALPPGPLPPAVESAGYRIVQESLTNVRRHAAATEAVVSVRLAGGALEVEIVDNGTAAGGHVGAGNGIRGMTERAVALGGRLTAEPVAGGGFRVHAVLPVSPVEAS
ncbi:histidine kinase [Actinoplanes sp. NBRC 101535]|uniref:sensor histidine kinase n=1 Tax=Actinoplanes sp. NBRC 101535 TaxID=3032196 RepID=UPI0024A5B1D4|nr:histidine kinase [Actinoplanes sp. NBRC 101535]GLY06676.1 two-component sensor histidine kinase [Actinoplanes sp. NBRC 101535]